MVLRLTVDQLPLWHEVRFLRSALEKRMCRAFTKDEVTEMFLGHMWSLVDYWSHQQTTDKEKLKGLLFSILATLDGVDMDMPKFLVIPDPHPADKAWFTKQRENYYEDFTVPKGTVCVEASIPLHNAMYEPPFQNRRRTE
jgi:hypothetical protein